MTSRVALLTLLPLLLIAVVGCPHAWSREGTIDQALERDMIEYYSMQDCALEEEDWRVFCMKYHEPGNTPEARQHCPPECRPGRPPGRP